MVLTAPIGCGKAPPKELPYVPALLGARTATTTDDFIKTCPTGQVLGVETHYFLQCYLRSGWYEIHFDARDRITDIALMEVSDKEAREHFDRALVGLLPAETRDLVSNSLGRDVTRGWTQLYMRGQVDVDGAVLFEKHESGTTPGAKDVVWALYGAP